MAFLTKFRYICLWLFFHRNSWLRKTFLKCSRWRIPPVWQTFTYWKNCTKVLCAALCLPLKLHCNFSCRVNYLESDDLNSVDDSKSSWVDFLQISWNGIGMILIYIVQKSYVKLNYKRPDKSWKFLLHIWVSIKLSRKISFLLKLQRSIPQKGKVLKYCNCSFNFIEALGN